MKIIHQVNLFKFSKNLIKDIFLFLFKNIRMNNKLYHNKGHLTLTQLEQLHDEIFGCKGTGNREEYEKSKQVNQNLFAEVENSYIKYDQELSGGGYEKI